MTDDRASLAEKQRLRLLFMKSVYDKTGGDRFTFTNLDAAAAAIGLDRTPAASVAQYLVDEGLIEWAYMGGGIGITHRGVVEVEEALHNPDRGTQHFPPAINVISIGSMSGTIQQGTVGSTQHATVSIASGESTELSEFLEAIKRRLAELGLSADETKEVQIQIETIESQLKSPHPRRRVLSAAGGVLVEILKSASGAAAAELVREIPAMLR